VDEMWVDAVREFDGKRLQSIAKGQVDLAASGDEPADEPEREQREKDFAPLLSWLGERLAEHVKQVRLSARLTTSPACLVNDAEDMTPALEKMYRAMGQDGPRVKRILELNPAHPLVTGLREAVAAGGEGAVAAGDEAGDALAEAAELLYGTAVLAEGGDLTDPARFARLLADRLARTL
jgi:molecular chaperone HtpG